ncbi:MAG: BlaI/MecI/CopY family transcriptional regulator [Acidobacteria bacterium]|nr:MAG: BlaI/MecI/CopY family transcriptional regulator [Acidobacteriota bacterium]
MARKRSPTLTDAELRLMEIIWDKGRVTVGELVDALPKRRALAYSTVLTTMRVLERKGYVDHEKNGRAFVYQPLVPKSEARRKALRFVLSRFFEDSPELLVLNLLEHEEIDSKQLARLRRRIEES